MLQIHPLGIRHIRRDGRINEWKSTGKRCPPLAPPKHLSILMQGGDESGSSGLPCFEMQWTPDRFADDQAR